MSGTRKAAVLPLPVCAATITSVFTSAAGIECFCTGVGLLYSQRLMLSVSSPGRLCTSQQSWKVSTGSSTPLPPRRSTSISSYWSKLIPIFILEPLKSSCSSRLQ